MIIVKETKFISELIDELEDEKEMDYNSQEYSEYLDTLYSPCPDDMYESERLGE